MRKSERMRLTRRICGYLGRDKAEELLAWAECHAEDGQFSADTASRSPKYAMNQLWLMQVMSMPSGYVAWVKVYMELPSEGWPDPEEWRLGRV